MKNPAVMPKYELNDFTSLVKSLSENGWGKVWVRLRNGEVVRPEYHAAEDDTCVDVFGVESRYRWNLDGSSLTRRGCDMMETVVVSG